MALKMLVLRAKYDEAEKKLNELRKRRVNLIREEKLLEDQINALDENSTQEERDQIEEKVNNLVSNKSLLESEIEKVEEELSEASEKMKDEEERSNLAVPHKRMDEKKGKYEGMKGKILRCEDRLFDQNHYGSEEKEMNLGKYIRGMVTGKWDDAEFEKRALVSSGASSLIPAPLFDRIIDKARNASIFTAANVPIAIMDTNNLRVVKIKEDLQAHFKAEGEAAEESSPMELEAVTLESKTIYGYAYVSLEAIDSAENLDTILKDSFGAAIAEGIDQAMLYGVYSGGELQSYAPAGIFNHAEINTVEAVNSDYDDIIKGIGRIKANNGIASAMAVNANTEEVLSLLKDKNGQYLAPPKAVTNVRQIVSNQLNHDKSTGSDILVFDPEALLIGVQKGINIKVFDGDTECIKRGLVCFRIMSMVDCVVLQPKHISRITGFGKETAV